MDGSGEEKLADCERQVLGIQIDVTSKRLYWADILAQKIMSRDPVVGGNGTTIRSLSGEPFGIAIHNQRLYWGYHNTTTIESMALDGTDFRNEYTGTVGTRHLTLPLWNPPKRRRNDCEGRFCDGVCVLTATSFTCLSDKTSV